MNYNVYTLNEKATEIVEATVMHFNTKADADFYRTFCAKNFGDILMMEPVEQWIKKVGYTFY